MLKTQAQSSIKSVEAECNAKNQMTAIIVEYTWVKAMLPSKYINAVASDKLIEVQIDTSFKEKHRMAISNNLTKVIGSDSQQIKHYFRI